MIYDKITDVKKIGIPQNADYYRIENGSEGCKVIFYDADKVRERFGNIIGFEYNMKCARLHGIPEKWKGRKMSYQEKHKRGNIYFFIEFEE